MSFTRSHHQVIAGALGCMNADVLRGANCLFAGGTALALRFGEYRESVDIDFVIGASDDFRQMRQRCAEGGFETLTIEGQRVVSADPLRMDQYGIRTRLLVMGVPVKFEIIREARIPLRSPGRSDAVMGVATASLVDLLAMKLLANSDRWTDPTAFSRDILDVAMVGPARPVLAEALMLAETAYGDSVVRDARAAIRRLLDRVSVLDRCRLSLRMDQPLAVLVQRLRRLSSSIDAIGGMPA